MKKILAVLMILSIPAMAFAVERNSGKVPAQVVLVGGGESITTILKTFSSSDGDGSEEVLSSTSRPCFQATVCASRDNLNPVYLGGSDVENNWRTRKIMGVPVYAGVGNTSSDNCVTFNIDNVNKLYGAAWASGDAVSITYTEFN